MGHTPYELVYEKEVLFPIEFQVKTFKMAVQLGMNLSEAQKHRLEQLNELDEIRQEAVQRTDLVQQQRAKWYDKYIRDKRFQEGDWALLFDSKFKDFQRKFQTHWLGPYEIENFFSNGAIRIKTIDEHQTPFLVNDHRLKVYHKTISKEEFIKIFQDNSEMRLVKKNHSSPPAQSLFFSSLKKKEMYKLENQSLIGILIQKIQGENQKTLTPYIFQKKWSLISLMVCPFHSIPFHFYKFHSISLHQ